MLYLLQDMKPLSRYDYTRSMLVRAKNEQEARRVAEKKVQWNDHTVKCSLIREEGRTGILMIDFVAG